jgi:hypothetical protein
MGASIKFLGIAAGVAIVLGVLFVVIVCAPEPWQTRPWTVWERCAQGLLFVFGWPLWAAALVIDHLPWKMPDRFATPFFVTIFLASGAFWVAVFRWIWSFRV